MKAPPIIPLYNQDSQTDEAFLASFVARGDLADFLLGRIRRLAPGAAAEAQLMVGPRGMGKTSLLRRIAIGVKQDAALKGRFIPLRFREEQYNVISLDRFWFNCAESLAEWCEENAPESVFPALFDRLAASDAWRDPETVAEAFRAETTARKARAILLVDNLDIILDALTPIENWSLRRALQASDGPLLIGASTHAPVQTGDREAAFYEFFRLHFLEPLSADGLIGCLRRIAEGRGAPGERVMAVLASQPERLRAVHQFTGGNPRILALIYKLLESENTDSAFADLEALLDQVTPYYKGRVEEYQTKLQRAVIDAIALNWDPIASHDVAAATATEITTISPQLIRLRRDGLIEDVELAGARSGYQLAERFFNIWYLMRHGTRRTRQRVSWLTKFLVAFYSPDDLRRMVSERGARGAEGSDFYREALEAASEGISAISPSVARSNGEAAARGLAWTDEVEDFTASSVPEERIAASDRVIARLGASTDSADRLRVATALVGKARALKELGRSEEAITTYDAIEAGYGAATELDIRELVARVLLSMGITLGALGRLEDEITTYDLVEARYGAASELGLREPVAKALVNKGLRLGALLRPEREIATYDLVEARYGAAGELGLREQVAKALVNKGLRLGALLRPEHEIATYDLVEARYGAAGELGLREQVAKALVNKGVTLGELGYAEEEIATNDLVEARYGAASELSLRELVANALINKGIRLGALGRSEQAIETYDLVGARYGAASELGLRKMAAKALVAKGNILVDKLARLDEAAETFLAATRVWPDDALKARAGLFWVALLTRRIADAMVLRRDDMAGWPAAALALMDAGLEIGADNFGAAMSLLDRALAEPNSLEHGVGLRDFQRFLRLAHMLGFGEKLIAHFESAGHAGRLAPIHAAFVALVRGERHLLNVNPETRGVATEIYRALVAPLSRAPTAQIKQSARKRGRPRSS